MRTIRVLITLMALSVASLSGAPLALAGSPVDGTTLTPPVLAGTPCFQDGPWVRCDTSGTTTLINQPGFELPCGQVYETGTDERHATRWYLDGLLVKRSVQASFRGTWSLSPTGDGPSVAVAGDWNWWIRFDVAGDDSTGVLTSHGNGLRVAGLGRDLRDTGIWLPDGTHHGLATFTDEAFDRLCEVLLP